MQETFFNKKVWMAMLIAIVLVGGGELILAWQYQRLETGRLPRIEQELERQNLELQERDAKDVLLAFLEVRLSGNEAKARAFLTEKSMEELEQGSFVMFGDFTSYEIQKTISVEDGMFRFQTALLNVKGMIVQLEVIDIKEILEEYYVHSVNIAG